MSIVPTKILLATDGSEDANLALRAAVDIAEKTGSELHVVHAWHSVPTARFEPFIRAQLKKEAQELLTEQVGHTKAKGGEVARAHLVKGSAVDEILDLAEELGVGLVVNGSRGMGSIGSLLVGSVSGGCPPRPLSGPRRAGGTGGMATTEDRCRRQVGASEEGRRARGGDRQALPDRHRPRTSLRESCRTILGWSAKNRRELDEVLLREKRALEERAKELQAIAGSRPESRLIETEPTLAMFWSPRRKKRRKPSSP